MAEKPSKEVCREGETTRDVSIINESGAPRPGVVSGGVVSGRVGERE